MRPKRGARVARCRRRANRPVPNQHYAALRATTGRHRARLPPRAGTAVHPAQPATRSASCRRPEKRGSTLTLLRPEDLVDQTPLDLKYGKASFGGVDWRTWLLRQGVNGQPVRRGLRFNSYPVVLQAERAGHGGPPGLSYASDPLLAERRLVCPVHRSVATREGHHLCTSNDAVHASGIQLFRNGSAVRPMSRVGSA